MKMKLTFALKLGLAITVLTLTVAGISVYYFYAQTYAFTVNLMNGRLADIGHTATFLFERVDRESIKRLIIAINNGSAVDPSEVASLKPGYAFGTLDEKSLDLIHSSADFLGIVQRLRIITYATMENVEPPRDFYSMENPLFLMKQGYVVAYLYIDAPETTDPGIVKFIASSAPFPTSDGWQGNPAGNLYRIVKPFYIDALGGRIGYSDDYSTDSFYSGITAVVPIKDEDGSVIAVLGLDYYAGNERDSLRKLKIAGVSILGMGLVFSIILALIVARRLSKPIQILESGALEIMKGNYDVSFDIRRNDEFGLLGTVFSGMVKSIRTYLGELEEKNRELAQYSGLLEKKVEERTAELTDANNRLTLLANSDGLTGLSNRRFFDEYMDREWRICRRQKTHIGIIMIDVDCFKAFNDLYGHLAGDECLKGVAQAIAGNLRRTSDLAARYGGEEFAAVVPHTDLNGAVSLAERIVEAVRKLEIPHENGVSCKLVTVSCGVSSMIPEGDFCHEGLIKKADEALYMAKENGRNRVEKYI